MEQKEKVLREQGGQVGDLETITTTVTATGFGAHYVHYSFFSLICSKFFVLYLIAVWMCLECS